MVIDVTVQRLHQNERPINVWTLGTPSNDSGIDLPDLFVPRHRQPLVAEAIRPNIQDLDFFRHFHSLLFARSQDAVGLRLRTSQGRDMVVKERSILDFNEDAVNKREPEVSSQDGLLFKELRFIYMEQPTLVARFVPLGVYGDPVLAFRDANSHEVNLATGELSRAYHDGIKPTKLSELPPNVFAIHPAIFERGPTPEAG